MVVFGLIAPAFPQQMDVSYLPNLVKQLKPSVVNISTTKVIKRKPFGFRSPFGNDEQFERFFEKFFGDELPEREFRNKGLGSGFIMSKDGYIVTNHHVISKAEEIEVIMENGEKYDAKIIGSDSKTDLALVKIEPDKPLPAIKFGDSSSLDIGEPVLAIGNPFGLGHTVTSGIVSAKGRSLGLGAYDDFIQIDAAINPGNSGGPLFNYKGEVVGVNTAIIAGGQGIGFAIPVNMAKRIVQQLKTSGKVVRGWLGVIVQQLTPELSQSLGLENDNGALVSDIAPEGPAAKAGLKRGDVIVAIDDKKIRDMSELPKTVANYKPGTSVNLTVIREGKSRNLTVTLDEMPTEKKSEEKLSENKVEQKLGLIVEEISPQIRSRYGIKETSGVIIIKVLDGSLADVTGFRTGDIILELNRKPVSSVSEYQKMLSGIKPGSNLLFLVKRQDKTIYLAMKYNKTEKQ